MGLFSYIFFCFNLLSSLYDNDSSFFIYFGGVFSVKSETQSARHRTCGCASNGGVFFCLPDLHLY